MSHDVSTRGRRRRATAASAAVVLAFLLSSCERYEAPAAVIPWQLLVADTGHGRAAVASLADGTATGDVCLADLVPDLCALTGDADVRCLLFEVAHELRDGDDAFTVAFGQRGDADAGFPGGVVHARLDADGAATVDWRVDVLGYPLDADADETCASDPDSLAACRLAMAHAHAWLPGGDVLAVTDTLNNRVVFVSPGAATGEQTDILAMLHPSDAQNPGAWWPNALDVVESDGRTLLLVTYKGADASRTDEPNAGRILLWDVTDLLAPSLVWAYPETGWIAAVHGGSVQDGPDGPLLVYGHARGASDDAGTGTEGSVGVARWNDDGPPTYLADVVLSDGEPLGFVRDVEIVEDGLLVTDSGCENQEAECERPGRAVTLGLELPDAPGLSGAFDPEHAQQVFVEADAVGAAFTGPLQFPFEADLLSPEERGSFLSKKQPSCIATE